MAECCEKHTYNQPSIHIPNHALYVNKLLQCTYMTIIQRTSCQDRMFTRIWSLKCTIMHINVHLISFQLCSTGLPFQLISECKVIPKIRPMETVEAECFRCWTIPNQSGQYTEGLICIYSTEKLNPLNNDNALYSFEASVGQTHDNHFQIWYYV